MASPPANTEGSGQTDPLRSALLAAGASLPAIMLFLAVLSIVLGAAPALGLSTAELTAWIIALYALPGALGLWLAIRYRQPLLLTGNVFVIIVVASLGGQEDYSDLVGASMVAGVLVALVGVFGLSDRLARWIPVPIMLGLLSGAVLPFVVRIFAALGELPLVVGSSVVGYLLARRFLDARVSPVLPALVAGLAVAALSGQLGPMPALAMPFPAITLPTFSLWTIVTVTPVLVALTTLQANVPSFVFLRTMGYEPPERTVDIVSGIGTVAGSLLGPTAISVPLPAVPLVAGVDAGKPDERYRAASVAGAALVAIGLLAGVAVALAEVFPLPLLLALGGLALINPLVGALKQLVTGSLVLGPIFAFLIAQSPLTLLGFGPYFWALTVGIGVSLLLERDEYDALIASSRRLGTLP